MRIRVTKTRTAERALFEIYAALELNTPYNAWETIDPILFASYPTHHLTSPIVSGHITGQVYSVRIFHKSYIPGTSTGDMNLSCQGGDPALVIVILWGIAIFTTLPSSGTAEPYIRHRHPGCF